MKRFKIAFFVIGFGWFPMMFVHAAAATWSSQAALILLTITFFICIAGCFILLSTNIERIFTKSETLDKEIAEARAWSLQSHRWTEALKRQALKQVGMHKEDIIKIYNTLTENNWKP